MSIRFNVNIPQLESEFFVGNRPISLSLLWIAGELKHWMGSFISHVVVYKDLAWSDTKAFGIIKSTFEHLRFLSNFAFVVK